jgi:hypothetical protein
MTEDTKLTALVKKVKNIRQYVFSGRTTPCTGIVSARSKTQGLLMRDTCNTSAA